MFPVFLIVKNIILLEFRETDRLNGGFHCFYFPAYLVYIIMRLQD